MRSSRLSQQDREYEDSLGYIQVIMTVSKQKLSMMWLRCPVLPQRGKGPGSITITTIQRQVGRQVDRQMDLKKTLFPLGRHRETMFLLLFFQRESESFKILHCKIQPSQNPFNFNKFRKDLSLDYDSLILPTQERTFWNSPGTVRAFVRLLTPTLRSL